jgi:hypothetical protein
MGAQTVVKGARGAGFGGQPIVQHVHAGIGGQSHRGGQRKMPFRRRATDVAAAVEIEHGAIGPADLRLERDGWDTSQLTSAA